MTESDLNVDFDAIDFAEALNALDKAIIQMGKRIDKGEIDKENEQVRIDRLNALSNAVDARRRIIEELPGPDIAEMWRNDLEPDN